MSNQTAIATKFKSFAKRSPARQAHGRGMVLEIDPTKVSLITSTSSSTYRVLDEFGALIDPQYRGALFYPNESDINPALDQYLGQATDWIAINNHLATAFSHGYPGRDISQVTGSSTAAHNVDVRLMSTGAPVVSKVAIQPDVHDEFLRLANEWRTTRNKYGSGIEIFTHPAYQQIIGMGPSALPFVVEALRAELDHWFWALKAITRYDPVPPDEIGNLEAMRIRWLAWADANKGIWQQKSTRTLYELQNFPA